MSFKAPYFSKEDLAARAEQFLSQYHPSGSLPVPIELIIEGQLGLDIIPVPGLHHFDVVAFITSDQRQIYVDDNVYNHRENRYRFSLAHEVGHLILHPELFREFHFFDIQSWKRVVSESLPEKEYSFIEWHAYQFAGHVLVPSAALVGSFQRCREMAAEVGLDLDEGADAVRDTLAGYMGKEFGVSAEVIRRRMQSDRLW